MPLTVLVLLLATALLIFVSYLIINAGESDDSKIENEISDGWDDNKVHTEGEI